jgi:UDP-N-acetylmuramate: L-alanyl-gamma-D-glutamyl-meso-diaminopimelate ligase
VARVLVLPPPTHGADGHHQLSFAEIIDRVLAAGVDAAPAENADAVIANLDATLKGDEVVLLLSSGPLDGLVDRLPPRMEDRFGRLVR